MADGHAVMLFGRTEIGNIQRKSAQGKPNPQADHQVRNALIDPAAQDRPNKSGTDSSSQHQRKGTRAEPEHIRGGGRWRTGIDRPYQCDINKTTGQKTIEDAYD